MISETTPQTLKSAERRRITLQRRWWFWTFIVPLMAIILPVVVHRGTLEYRCAQIRRAGGGVSVGPLPIYQQLIDRNRVPRPLWGVCRSKPVEWYFSQFPVAYSIGLRGVRDSDDVGAALETAKKFPYLRGIMLYQSGVRDEHLDGIATACPRLERLVINETALTDEGVRHLRGLRRIVYINAQRTSITNESVPILAEFPRLKELAVGETGITTVELIRGNRPMCKVHTRLKVATPCPKCHWPLNECRCDKNQAEASDDG